MEKLRNTLNKVLNLLAGLSTESRTSFWIIKALRCSS